MQLVLSYIRATSEQKKNHSGQKENNKEEVMVTDDDKQGKYCLVSLAFAGSDISLAAASLR